MKRALLSLLVVLCAGASARGDTAVVVGVVIFDGSNARAPGIPVSLYCTRDGGCDGSPYTTAQAGLYTFVRPNVDNLVNLYVSYDGSDYVADPITLPLKTARQDNKLLVLTAAKDLRLMRRQLTYNESEGSRHIAAVMNTLAVKKAAGVLDADTAAATARKEAAGIAALTRDANQQPVKLDVLYTGVEKQLNPNLKGHEVIKKDDFINLHQNPQFQKTRQAPLSHIGIDPATLKGGPGKLPPAQLRKMLDLPGKDVKVEWLDRPETYDFVRAYVRLHGGEPVHFTVVDRQHPDDSHQTVEVSGNTSNEAIREMLKEAPNMRAWALAGGLQQEKKWSPEQKQVIDSHARNYAPVMVKPQGSNRRR